ncbi:PspC domain-containing protein [Aeromicrobium sp. A1-2]|uniref:PspC domain-containing protein n=1 Tax=Aeromicrobium sp. A1-2 TaxID=2107713 RepID=UPI0013C2E8A6|nr:PspC domain-containing protein [Aeromicrobium sp. A1-2]
MNAERTLPPEPDDGFEPQRLRTITDMKRSTDDRMLGGVASGAAKYLNIDPVIVRVVIAVLTVVGFAGLILYVAAWFLLPAEGEERSIAADWFKLDKNEEQVRIAGMVGAAVLAVIAIVGDNGYAWWGFPWLLVPAAAIYYLFAVRPRRRRAAAAELAAYYAQHAQPVGARTQTPAHEPQLARRPPMVGGSYARPPRDQSWALTWLTLSLAAIALASTRIYAEYHESAPWPTYVAVALGVVAIGLLVSTVLGHGGPLIAIGILLAAALAIGSLIPSGRIGADYPTPLDAGQVDGTYKHGVGLLELDLTDVADPDALLGRTVSIRAGVGQTKVMVPAGLNVEVTSQLGAGQVVIFDRQAEGTRNRLAHPADSGPALTIDIHQRIGNIEVIRK